MGRCSKEHRHRIARRLPRSAAGALETLQKAAGRIPIRRETDDELLAIGGHPGGMRTAGDEKQQCRQKHSSKRA